MQRDNRTGRTGLLLATMCSLALLPGLGGAAVINAASASFADVAAAVRQAVSGDTVLIPAGSATWNSTLTITNAITLQGTGTGSETNRTVIVRGSGNFPIELTMTSDQLVRVSNIYFKLVTTTNDAGMWANTAIFLSGSMAQLRIDYCRFDYGNKAVYKEGRVFGVIDHCYYYNNNISIELNGGNTHGNQSWSEPIVAGMDMGTDTLYVEDNVFIVDDRYPGGLSNYNINNRIESGHGGRFVVRHNKFDGHLYRTDGSYTFFPIMTHGNGNYYGDGTQALRGHPIIEIYNNLIRGYRIDNAIFLRGGSSLIHDNEIFYESGTPCAITLREEEARGDGSPLFSPGRAKWPAEDQVFNTFIWNNTSCKGFPGTGSVISNASIREGSEPFIQQDRDYFMHAPAATGGKEYFAGRPGASNTAPSTNANGTMVFTNVGPNAYYPYTPFTYPHPLVKEKLQPPWGSGPPQNLRERK